MGDGEGDTREKIEAGDYVMLQPDTPVHAETARHLKIIGAIGQVVMNDVLRGNTLVRFANRESTDRWEPGHSTYSFPTRCWELADVDALTEAEQSENQPKVDSPALTIGCTVYSETYGRGRVEALANSLADVRFDDQILLRRVRRDSISTTSPATERDALQARIRELEDVLRPFALAAKDEDIQRMEDDAWLLIRVGADEVPIWVSVEEILLKVEHLRAAAKAMPDATTATSDSE